MNTQSLASVRGASFIQIVMLLAWLCVTEYVVALPFYATATVAVVLIALGGAITSRRTARAFTVLAEAYRLEGTRKVLEFHRVVSMMPPLYEAFRVLHPRLANSPYGLCHFAGWLNMALRNPQANIIEWAMSYGECTGKERPNLRGLDGHVAETHRAGVAEKILYATLAGHANVVLLREESARRRSQTNEGAAKVAA